MVLDSAHYFRSLHTSQMAHQAGAYPGFCNIKRLGVFLLPSGWDASPSEGYPQHLIPRTHLYTWVERGTVRVKCLAQEHHTMSPARARTKDHNSIWWQAYWPRGHRVSSL